MRRFCKQSVLSALLVLLLMLSACAKAPAGVTSFTLGSDINSPGAGSADLHLTQPEDGREVAASEGLRLLFDDASAAVAVYDPAADTYWSSLPSFANASGAVLNAALVSASGRWYLNAQDHCAAFGSFKTENIQNGVRVTYVLSDTAATAKKQPQDLQPGEPYLRVPVEYRLVDGELRVTVDCEEIFVADGFVVEKLSLLPYFGALSETAVLSETSDRRSFLLVPDGCGAVMYADTPDAATGNLTFRLYADESGANTASADVGCFGLSRGDAAFACVITEGDAVAAVRAVRACANTDGVNLVYPEFTLTPYAVSGSTYTFFTPYTGKLAVTYKFLHDTAGAYAPLAAACREALIRSGFLPAETVQKDVYPLNASFIFSVDGRAATAAGKLEQAEEVSGLLRSKGVNDVSLILNGLFSGGLYQTDATGYSVLRSAGGKKALRTLCEYAASQSIAVYAGVNLLLESSALSAACDLQGKKLTARVENPLSATLSAKVAKRYLTSADNIASHVIRLLDRTESLPLTGYAVNDAQKLYADYGTGTGAQEVAGLLSRNLSAVAAEKQLLLRGANFRLLKNAALVTELSTDAYFTQSEGYEAVPLLQMLLHGSVVYSASACNLDGIAMFSLLKSVEFGACIAVEWDFLPQSRLFYERTYTEVSEFYVRARTALADLSARRITGHQKVYEGVYSTTFDGGVVICVNYNNYSVNIGNITVPPYDFLRIN